MGFSTKERGGSVAYNLSSTDGDIIMDNGLLMLNNWEAGDMRTATLHKGVDYIKLVPWDSEQSKNSYANVKLPLDATSTDYHTIRYQTNHPVTIYRNRNSSGDKYSWNVKYEGYDYVRNLGASPDSFNLRAGKQLIIGSESIPQSNTAVSWSIDDYTKVRASITIGTTVNMAFQVKSGSYSCVHKITNSNVPDVAKYIGTIDSSTTNANIDPSSRNQQVSYIETVIHSNSHGRGGQWMYKYEGRFTHGSDNKMYYYLEAEYNPRYTV